MLVPAHRGLPAPAGSLRGARAAEGSVGTLSLSSPGSRRGSLWGGKTASASPRRRGGERGRADYSSRRAAGTEVPAASLPAPGSPRLTGRRREPMEGAEEEPLVQCPVCQRELPAAHINSHLDRCLEAEEGEAEPGSSPSCKRPRLAAAPPGSQAAGEPGEPEEARPAAAPPVFSLFHKGRGGGGQSPGAPGRRSGAGREEAAAKPEDGGSAAAAAGSGASLARKLEGKPLAEQLRPDTLGDYVGQERVLGAQTLLRSLLESHEIPSLILWGPPGCGKVSGAAGPRRRSRARRGGD